MGNVLDYMAWRDISLRKVGFNEIDNLILARLSYIPFEGTIFENERITIKECYERYLKTDNHKEILWPDDEKLFEVLAKSKRFGNAKLTKYVNKIDKKEEIQFSAITILLDDYTMYISYRGTDNTIVGWKEDLNMSFQDQVPSQPDAVKYLEDVAKKIKRDMRIGGHSKGGNLAVYAAAFCKPKLRKRILKVYNNEGPGFTQKIINSQEYRTILPKVHRYIPQSSIIGRLLNNQEKTTVVKSTSTGIMQHDLFSWQLIGDKMIECELTKSSEFIDKTITEWLEKVSNEQRAEFFDCFFDILYSTNATTMQEIGKSLIESSRTMFKTYKNLTPETKEMLKKTIKSMLEIGRENIEFPKISIRKPKIIKEDKNNKDILKEEKNETTEETNSN